MSAALHRTGPHRAGLPLVGVLLGTDHHRFDRLVEWSATLAAEGGARWFVQHGSTPLPSRPPVLLSGAPLLELDDLEGLLADAACVVTHGGPGLIMEARAAGHVPLVVPRRPELGEHVDDHQLRFSERVAATGHVVRVDDLAALRRAVGLALLRGRGPATGQTARPGVASRFGELVSRVHQRH